MKKSLFFTMLCLFAMFNSLNAQTTELIIGDDTQDVHNSLPSYEYYNYSISQQIYTAEELGGEPSVITSIAFRKGYTQSTVERKYDVYLVNVDKTSFDYNGWYVVSESDLVYSGWVEYPYNMDEWMTIKLQNEFNYTGGDILLCVDDNTGNYAQRDSYFDVYTAGDNRSIYAYDDNINYDPKTQISAYGYRLFYANTIKFTMRESEEVIVDGDTWQNAVDVTEYPFVHTPVFADLNDNYDLPGTAADGPDAVYRLNLTEETTISASVTGTNGKIALYTADFYGEDGPGIENLYVEPETTFFYDFETDCLATDFVIFDRDTQDNSNLGIDYNFQYSAENRNIFSASWLSAGGALYPDNYIHTKKKYLITETSQISYDVIKSHNYKEHYSLIISEDGVNFIPLIEEDAKISVPKTYYFVGTPYVGKSFYIGFRHHDCFDGWDIAFDNFRLSDGSKDAAQKSGSNTLEHTLPAGTYYIAASATSEFTVNIDNAFIAQVDDAKYESMEEAVEAATAGQTVTLLKDTEGPAFNVNKSITIDFNNKTYTINDSNPVNISAGTLTLINGTFAGQDGFKNLVNITGGAQLEHNTAITGTITKTVEGTNQGWGTISTPVGNVSHANVTGLLLGKPELYLYDEANEYWRYYSDTENPEDVAQPFTSLEAGRGYLYANENNTYVVFEGTFGVSSVNFDLSCSSEGQLRGFNMIGNPFTHDVNEVNFSTSGGASLSDGFYVISGGGAWTAKTNDTYIAPMESALVKTNMATTLTISNAPTSKSRGESKGYLKIDVSNSNYSDVAYVSFDSGLGLDKIAHRNAEIPMVYVPVDGVNYAIAKMDESVTEVPVSFKAMTMGEYTISAKALGCEYEQITLVDKMTGVMTNMLLEDYTFIARTTDKSERFLIKLVAKEDAEDTEHFAYINNGALVINSIKGEGRVRIFDVMGRSVAEYEVSGSANIPVVSLRSGVYLVHKSDENGVKVQKVVID